MTHVAQHQIKKAYNEVFNCFITGKYRKGGDPNLTKIMKKPMKENQAHEATLDFLLCLFCEEHNLPHHKNYYKKMYLPLEKQSFNLDGIDFNDLMAFISPETRKTM